MSIADRIKQAVSSGGTGSLTLGAALTGFRTVATAVTAGEMMVTDYYDVPYVLEWSSGAGWEVGYARLSNSTTVSDRLVHSNSAGTTDKSNIPVGATFCVARIARLSSDIVGPNVVIGFGLIESPTTQAGNLAIAGWCFQGDGGIAIGEHAETLQDHEVCVRAARNSSLAQSHARAVSFTMGTLTTDATATDMFLDDSALRPTVPSGRVWLVQAFIVAVVSASQGTIGNIYTRELRAVGKPTGQIGSTVTTAIASDAGFTGSATMTVNASGGVKVTVTGIAATTIKWAAQLRVTEVIT
jgi:hypothetical protein